MDNPKFTILIHVFLTVYCITSIFGAPKVMFISSESSSGSEEVSLEYQMDRSIGFMKKVSNVTTPNPYPFNRSNHPDWRTSASERMRAIALNDTDPSDDDYYAMYDFEFAKSAVRTPNFSAKLRKYQLDAKAKTSSSSQNQIPPGEPDKPEPVKKTEDKKEESLKEDKKDEPKAETKEEPKEEIKKEELKEEVKKEESKPETKEEPKEEVKKEEPKAEIKEDIKKDEPKEEVKKEEPKSETKIEEPKAEPKQEPNEDIKNVETKAETKEKPKADIKKEEPKEETKKDEPKEKTKKDESKEEELGLLAGLVR